MKNENQRIPITVVQAVWVANRADRLFNRAARAWERKGHTQRHLRRLGGKAMKLTITINMDNSAFDDGNSGGDEVSRILFDLADSFQDDGPRDLPILDSNGNTVGKAQVSQ